MVVPVVDLLALFVYGSNSIKERVAPGIGALVLGLGDLGILQLFQGIAVPLADIFATFRK